MMLSLNCDLRVGLAGTRVGITEVKVGRGSPWAVPLLWMLPQPVVSELLLTGETMPIERLCELGFVNAIEPTPDSVRARAQTLAETIRDNAPLSVEAAKASLRSASDLGCAAGLAMAEQLYRKVYDSEDAQEGPLAFSEKRKPEWKGR
jgi:enoyl-CoA hydratase/carnithine racemase